MTVTGPGTFDTHEAALFAANLGVSRDMHLVGEALATCAASTRPTLVEGAEALVAAEVIAAAVGNPSPFLPAPLHSWIAEDPPTVDATWVDLALQGVRSVLSDDSELCEQGFRDAGPGWVDSVIALRARLGG